MIKKLMLFTSIIWLILSSTNITYGSEKSIKIEAIIIQRKNVSLDKQWEFYDLNGEPLIGSLTIDEEIPRWLTFWADHQLLGRRRVIVVENMSDVEINYTTQQTLSLKTKFLYTGTPFDLLIKEESKKEYIGNGTLPKNIVFQYKKCEQIILDAKDDFAKENSTIDQIFLLKKNIGKYVTMYEQYNLYKVDLKNFFVKTETSQFNYKYVGIPFAFLVIIIAAYCFYKNAINI